VLLVPRLRPLVPADLPFVLDVNEADVDVLAPLDAARLRDLTALAHRADLIEVDDEHAGFVLVMGPGAAYDSPNYGWFSARYGADFLYLDRIVIAQGFRRRRLGSLVYEEVERDAAARGRLALEVNLEPPNHASLAFHRDRGYAEVGQRRDEAGKTVSLLVKELPTKGRGRH
jgi:predicted GNAT superfamily acetyltransferase